MISLPSFNLKPSEFAECGVTRLLLSRFRVYTSLDVFLAPIPVVITGANGAGKTNILESLSLLSPGKGLHSVKLSQITTNSETSSFLSSYAWTVSVDLELAEGPVTIGTGLETTVTGSERRLVKINGSLQKSQGSLTSWLSVVWVTPQMGRLFIDSSLQRRKFIDRFVFAIDPTHADRLHRYDHLLRQRSLLLKERSSNHTWLSVLEKNLAEDGIAIVSARQEMARLLTKSQESSHDLFPHFTITMTGELEEILKNQSALTVEEFFSKKLEENRYQDSITGGARLGPHRSDFHLVHLAKNMPAEVCSTGEQKMLLLALVLAFVKVQSQQKPQLTLLLLDDVVAHLDDHHRTILFQELCAPGTKNNRLQTWMTGTDPHEFSDLRPYAQFFSLENATLK